VKVGVIGCGFAGLAAAIAFRQTGHDVSVFERSVAIPATSAAVSLAPNAFRCLQILGVAPEYPPGVISGWPATIRNAAGRVLIRRTLAQFAGGDDYSLVPRSQLLESLLVQLPQRCVHMSAPVTRVDPSGELEVDGSRLKFDMVVAADGVRSACRQALWPRSPTPHRTGITARTWMVDRTLTDGFGVIWGYCAEFGILPLNDGRTYVWSGSRSGHTDLGAYRDWPQPLPELVDAAGPAMTTVELTEVRVPRHLSYGRVVLIGDAAHAMRPSFGQGAALAMEDAITLARGGAVRLSRRRARMHSLYWMSRVASFASMPRYRALSVARDSALGLIPDGVLSPLFGSVSRWSAPST
jgi:2-polyprenyl-6-methoxyphenol hydroxylase-like FAD-dependent oxidoreductase